MTSPCSPAECNVMVTFNSGEGQSAHGWGAKQCEEQHMYRMTLQPHLCPDVARVTRHFFFFLMTLCQLCPLFFKNIAALINLHADSEVAKQGPCEFLLTSVVEGGPYNGGGNAGLKARSGLSSWLKLTGILCEC